MTGPLSGSRVLVTRTRERAGGIVDALHALGAAVVVVPLIATEVVATPSQIAAAAERLASARGARWVAFTSATAARIVLGVVPPERMAALRVAVVGPETAAAAAAGGRAPDLVAVEHDAAGLAGALLAHGASGGSVWLPVAAGAGPVLRDALLAAGAGVELQAVYRTVMPVDAPRRLAAALHAGLHAVTLTSGSTARHLVLALDGASLDPETVIACIGRQTAAAAAAAGLRVDVVATTHTGPGLAEALARHWAARC